MSDSAALLRWRHRAQGAEGGAERWLSWKAVLAAASAVLAFTVFGGMLRTGRAAPVATPHVAGPPACAAVTSPLHADVDGDGCEEGVSFADGVLTAGTVRMGVGAPGDQVAVGRWTCGAATVALLRPTTGEVVRFDGWATQAAPLPAVPLGRVEGATGVLAAPRNGGRCDDVLVTRSSGVPVLLPERPVAG